MSWNQFEIAAPRDLVEVVHVELDGNLGLGARLEPEVAEDLKEEDLHLDPGDLHPDALSGTHSEGQVAAGDDVGLVLKNRNENNG